MNFSEVLNKYLNELNCTPKDLSNESEISQTVISRYRKGERTPVKDSIQIQKLAMGIYKLSKKNNLGKYTLETITNELNKAIYNQDTFNYEVFSNNFNILISSLNINMNEMARYIAFDSSHISRIRYGKAKPSNPIDFAKKVCNFVFSRYKSPEDISTLSTILNCNENSLNNNNFYNTLFSWLTNENEPKTNKEITDFLKNLDTFNLSDYIKAIKFDELKVPNLPFYKGKTKNYYGIEEMKQGELDFFKSTVLSKSKDDVFMCSDMPMEDMAKDVDFGKKWMFAIAMTLKKGLHLNMIHNLDRPFNEMMLGLESWIPIYMTGQISPYYLKNDKNTIHQHLNYVSGAVALTGECIKGFHNNGKYYLTNNKKEISYYKQKSDLMLKKANHLMDIYKEEDKKKFNIFLSSDEKEKGDRKRILSSLPIFTIDNDLLLKILKRNNVPSSDTELIMNYKEQEKKYIDTILKENKICDILYNMNEEEFVSDPEYLLLNNMFYGKNITYTYEEYQIHLKNTEKYMRNNKNYEIIYSEYKTFKNITITNLNGNYVIVSKNTNPTIHFVIRHPKLCEAITNFNPLVKE